MKSETAWEPAYSSVGGADDTRVPECTEGFMVLIKGIEGWYDDCQSEVILLIFLYSLLPSHSLPYVERYKPLSSTRHQLRFLELQRDLLLEFHQDLANNWRAVSRNPLVPQAAAYINAANYIATVLKQWGETEVSRHACLYHILHVHVDWEIFTALIFSGCKFSCVWF